MLIFKQLNKKGYKHYYEGTIEELDSMDKDNPHLHSEIMQVIMWLYEKYGVWINVTISQEDKWEYFIGDIKTCDILYWGSKFNSLIEAYKTAINKYCLNN